MSSKSIEKSVERRLESEKNDDINDAEPLVDDITVSIDQKLIYYKKKLDEEWSILCHFDELMSKTVSEISEDYIISDDYMNKLQELKYKLNMVTESEPKSYHSVFEIPIIYEVSVREKDNILELYIPLETDLTDDYIIDEVNLDKVNSDKVNSDKNILDELNNNYFDFDIYKKLYKLETAELYVDGLDGHVSFYKKNKMEYIKRFDYNLNSNGIVDSLYTIYNSIYVTIISIYSTLIFYPYLIDTFSSSPVLITISIFLSFIVSFMGVIAIITLISNVIDIISSLYKSINQKNQNMKIMFSYYTDD